MRQHLTFLFIGIICAVSTQTSAAQDTQNRIDTTIDTTRSGELVMIQELTMKAPLQKVWDAYTTEEGWEGWAVPLAEIDFRVNGTIKTNYNSKGTIGDSTTIVTHILNYVPHRLITLQAEMGDNFPDFLIKDEKDLYNVITFEQSGPSRTRLVSYGIGYKNNEQYHKLMNYFIQANRETLGKLIEYVEHPDTQ